jgi:hypothetical protein
VSYALRPTAQEGCGGIHQPLAMPEHPIAVAPNKFKLMPAAFLAHLLPIQNRVRFGQLRGKLAEQVYFGSYPIERRLG